MFVTLGAALLVSCTSTLASNTAPPSTSPVSSPSPTPSPSPSPSPMAPVAVASVPTHAGEVGIAYATVTLGAAGGTAPYSWSVAGGALPPGLSLSTGGLITGTNSASGAFSFTVQVSDTTGASATAPAKVTVYPHLKITQQPCVGQCTIGQGCAKCGGFGAVGGGLPPYLYRIVGGAVPPGMKYSGLGVSGPFPAGLYSLSVQVNDSLGAAVTVGANWAIYSPSKLVQGTACVNSGNPPSCTSARW
ncbi:MAG: Ig domain-containing protein, partial [Gemmataceae bacterium]